MLRFFFAAFILTVCAVVALAGFRGSKMAHPPIEIFPDMDHQPKYQPQHPSGFFADGRAARTRIEGTIPLGYTLEGRFLQAGARNGALNPAGFSNLPDYYNTGKMGDSYGDGLPLEVTAQLLNRGEERFNINCAICHGKSGAANGIVTQYGLVAVANFHDERIRTMPDGQIFSAISNGKNTMGAYGPLIALEDRWAIVAYVRALQRSQNAQVANLSEAQQKQLQQPAK
jgi:mono/diheme cytochrome c family protein